MEIKGTGERRLSMKTNMKIYCCGCKKEVDAKLTDGKEIYAHRTDLFDLPFWKCETCGNFVGCHYKTANRTAPLGCIPTREIKDYRKKIHDLIDPLWKNGRFSRREIYRLISDRIGYRYHTANIKSVDEAKMVISIVSDIIEENNDD